MARFIAASKISSLLKTFESILKNSWKKYIGITATYLGAGISFALATVQSQNVMFKNISEIAKNLEKYYVFNAFYSSLWFILHASIQQIETIYITYSIFEAL